MSRKYAICCACAAAVLVMGQTNASHAFALERLATAIDVSHFAASDVPLPASALAANIPSRLVLPTTIDLLGATTEVRVGIPSECTVTIEVADDAGAPLFLAQVHMPAGWQKIGFSGRDTEGHLLPNGTYYYTVTAEGTSRTTRVNVSR